MEKKVNISLPKGKEAKNVQFKVKDGKIEVIYDLEDKFEPKFGDIVRVESHSLAFERDYTICIYPNKNEQYNQCYIEDFFDIANIDMSGRLCFSCGNAPVGRLNIVRASYSEKQELFDKLAEVGKRWNPDTKQLEDIRWRAELGDYYYYIPLDNNSIRNNTIVKEVDEYKHFDNHKYENGNYFKTPEAARKVVDQIKDVLKNSKAE